MMKRAIPKCTASQQDRQDRLRARGCIACIMEMCDQPLPTEVNHITFSGRQLGQDFTEALCQWHHRGICLIGITVSEMTTQYGPSMMHNKRWFERSFGTPEKRLEFQNSLIGWKAEEKAIPFKRRTSLSSNKIVARKI